MIAVAVPLYLALAGALLTAVAVWGMWDQARWRRIRRSRFRDRPAAGAASGLERWLKPLEQTRVVEWLEENCRRADLHVGALNLFLGLVLAALVLAAALYRLLPLGPGSAVALAFPLTLVAVARYFRNRQQTLVRAFDEHLAEAARVLADSLRAGRSVHQALGDVPGKVRDRAVARAFRSLCRELELNASLLEAFTSLSQRIRSRELRWLQTTLLTLHEVGGDTAGVMDRMAQRLVERTQTRREVLAASQKSRSVAFMVIAMGFGFVLVIGAIFPASFGVFLTAPGAGLLLGYGAVQWGIWKLTARVTHYDG